MGEAWSADEVLRAQGGLISLDQALRGGMTVAQVRWRLKSGAWRQVHRGVYRAGPAEGSWTERVLGNALRCEGVAAYRCAAALHGMDRLVPFRCIELVTPKNHRRGPRGRGARDVRIIRVQEPYYDQVTLARNIQATSVPWTLAMMGRFAPAVEVEWALDWAARKGHVTWDDLDAFLRAQSWCGRAGFRVLRDVLDLRGRAFVPTDSLLETLFLQLCRDEAFPRPVQQYPVRYRGRTLHVDFAFPQHRVLVETLGRKPHDPSGRAFDDDRARANLLRLLMPGWTVLEFTWKHLTRCRLWVVRTTAHALGLRADHSGQAA